MTGLRLSPSILTADFGRLGDEIASVAEYVDWFHLDVMDGHFVSGIDARKFAVLGVLWPSKKFAEEELIPSGAAAAGSPVRIHYRHEPRPGISHARNNGVAAARGQFIVFIPGAPDFVNAAFNAAFAAGFTNATSVTLVK